MADAASAPELKSAFLTHLAETKHQRQRLDEALQVLGKDAGSETCQAMKGLIEEGQEIIAGDGDPAAKDAALIGAAQKVEHYEIAGYGTARTFAEVLGEDDVADLLQTTLDEETATDERLTEIAESGLNEEAAAEGR